MSSPATALPPPPTGYTIVNSLPAPPAGYKVFDPNATGPDQGLGAGVGEYFRKMNPLPLGNAILEETGAIAKHPVEEVGRLANEYGRRTKALLDAAGDAYKAGDYAGFAQHLLNYALNAMPGVGEALDEAGNKMAGGDTTGGLADTAALATQIILGLKAGTIGRGTAAAIDAIPELPGKAMDLAKRPGVVKVARGAAKLTASGAAMASGNPVALVGGGAGVLSAFQDISAGLEERSAAAAAAAATGGHDIGFLNDIAGQDFLKLSPEKQAGILQIANRLDKPVPPQEAPTYTRTFQPFVAPADQPPGETMEDVVRATIEAERRTQAGIPATPVRPPVAQPGESVLQGGNRRAAPPEEPNPPAPNIPIPNAGGGTALRAPLKVTPESLFTELQKSGTVPEGAEPGEPFGGRQPANEEEFAQRARDERAAAAAALGNVLNTHNVPAADLEYFGPAEWKQLAESVNAAAIARGEPGVEWPTTEEAQQKLIEAATVHTRALELAPTNGEGANPSIADRLEAQAQAAADRIKARGNFSGTTLSVNPLDLRDAADLAIYGAAKLAGGTVKFGAWSKEMAAELGDAIKPQLEDLYAKAQKIYERNIETTEGNLPSTRELLRRFKQGIEGAGWYNFTKDEIGKIFGADRDTFINFLAATSPNTTVQSNVTLALKAYRQWKMGQPFEGFLPETVNSLNNAVAGKDFGGLKVSSFAANLHGDPMPVTVDRWIARAFGYKTKTITDPQYKLIDSIITQLAAKRGVAPREMQAAIWRQIKEAEQTNAGNTSEAFEGLVRDKVAQDPELAALIKAGAQNPLPAPTVVPKAWPRPGGNPLNIQRPGSIGKLMKPKPRR